MANDQPEVWMRGPVEGVPPLLQPVAHALLQAVEEVERLLVAFPNDLLWKKPAGVASVAFHLQHLTGVLDRMVTYARQLPLSEKQFEYLKQEGIEAPLTTTTLINSFRSKVAETVAYLKTVNEKHLTEFRPVGRKQLPSTVMGLLFHAAEHTMRHLGQMIVTARIVRADHQTHPGVIKN